MYRSAICLSLLLILAGAVSAKTPVYLYHGSEFAVVARGMPNNLVVWKQGESNCLYAARLSPDLVVEDPLGLPVPGSDAVRTGEYDVRSNGEDFLVAWVDQPSGVPGPYYLECSAVDHDGGVTGPYPIAGPTNWQMFTTAVAFRSATTYPGQCYMVVWVDMRNGRDGELWAARVRQDGSTLDPGGFYVASFAPENLERQCDIASDGERFLVVWNDVVWGAGKVHALMLDADDAHSVHARPDVYDDTPNGDPAAAYDLTSQTYQVVYRHYFDRTVGPVWTRTLNREGFPTGLEFAVQSATQNNGYPRIASGDGNYVAVWQQTYGNEQAMWRGLANGYAATSVSLVCPEPGSQQYNPDVASNGDNYVVVWDDNGSVWTDTVSFWQRHFYTTTLDATAPNQSRHIALDPATGWLHMVYVGVDMGNWPPIYYTYSTDGGEHWWPSEFVGNGTGPCIACEGQGGLVWVSYRTPAVPRSICTAVRTALLQWQTFLVCDADAYSAPAMAICHDPAMPGNDAVYVVYATQSSFDATYVIHLKTVSVGQGVSEMLPPVVGPVGEQQDYPSIAVTPGDILHVTWRAGIDEQPPRVCYRQRDMTHQWLGIEEVTDPLWAPPDAKPAFNPSVEAWGPIPYAVWRAQPQGTPGKIYRASRPPSGASWTDFRQRGLAPNQYSDCPQQSTQWACTWQEGQSADIWANVFELPDPFWVDDPPSVHPSCVARWSDVGTPPRVQLYTVWTNGSVAPFEVLFENRGYGVPEDGFDGFVYYDGEVGKTVKPYCLARDGYTRWRDYSVDYGRESLSYRLPYLNPSYDYKLQAVLYQTKQDTWEQSFAFDGTSVGQVRFGPLTPETVLFSIPRESYAKDCRADFEVTRLAGVYAVLADMKLFKCFPYEQREGEDGVQSGVSSLGMPALRVAAPVPSLFKELTSLSYAVAEPRHVAINVYDIQGRVVRRLAAGLCPRGKHTARWNGLDDLGRRVPGGAYVIRVESDGLSQTRKVILTK